MVCIGLPLMRIDGADLDFEKSDHLGYAGLDQSIKEFNITHGLNYTGGELNDLNQDGVSLAQDVNQDGGTVARLK